MGDSPGFLVVTRRNRGYRPAAQGTGSRKYASQKLAWYGLQFVALPSGWKSRMPAVNAESGRCLRVKGLGSGRLFFECRGWRSRSEWQRRGEHLHFLDH